MSSILSSSNSVFNVIYTDNDIYGLCDGDYYFDTRDNRYYIYYNMGTIEISTTLISTSNITSSTYSGVVTPSYLNSYTYYDKESLKTYLKENPELLDELICDLRKEKINKLRNK